MEENDRLLKTVVMTIEELEKNVQESEIDVWTFYTDILDLKEFIKRNLKK